MDDKENAPAVATNANVNVNHGHGNALTTTTKAEVLPGTLTVFTRTTCKHCVAAKKLLETKPFVRVCVIELDVVGGGDTACVEAARGVLRELSDGAKTVPQIFLNSTHVPGGNSNLQELEASGKLDDVLRSALSAPSPAPLPLDLVNRAVEAVRSQTDISRAIAAEMDF